MKKKDKIILAAFFILVILFSLAIIYYDTLYGHDRGYSNIVMLFAVVFGIAYPFFLFVLKIHPFYKGAISFLSAILIYGICESLYPHAYKITSGDVTIMELFVLLFAVYWVISTAIMFIAAGVKTLSQFIEDRRESKD